MIVRNILQNPEVVINNFDHFNDFDDTARFLRGENTPQSLEILKKLEEKNKEWRTWLGMNHFERRLVNGFRPMLNNTMPQYRAAVIESIETTINIFETECILRRDKIYEYLGVTLEEVRQACQ